MRSLDGLSDQSVQCIRDFLRQPLSAAVLSVEFQLFVDAENYGAPSIFAYFIGDNLKTSERSCEIPLNLNELEELDDRYFTDFKFGGVNLIADVFKSWFAELVEGWRLGVWSASRARCSRWLW